MTQHAIPEAFIDRAESPTGLPPPSKSEFLSRMTSSHGWSVREAIRWQQEGQNIPETLVDSLVSPESEE